MIMSYAATSATDGKEQTEFLLARMSTPSTPEFHEDDDFSPAYQPQWRKPLRLSQHINFGGRTLAARPMLMLFLAAMFGYIACFFVDRSSLSQTFSTSTSYGTWQSSNSAISSLSSAQRPPIPPKPAGVKVIGFIFYGRPQFVNILDCYLRKNLVSNGGYLDEVHFIANTNTPEDLEWLDMLLGEVPEYKKINMTGDWNLLWRHAADLGPEDILVKMDDDLIFIADGAIPYLVHSTINHPEAYAVGGNIINSPHSVFWQYHADLLLPYLPENYSHPVDSKPSWRASDLPLWPGPNADPNTTLPSTFEFDKYKNPKHNMTRWLPLEPTSRNLLRTPAVKALWPAPKDGWTLMSYDSDTVIEHWQMGAQAHYSFLHHLETEPSLQRYSAPGDPTTGIWNMQYERYSLNFMAMRAKKIANLHPEQKALNDEVAITMGFTKDLKEPFLVDTRAIVSHFSFRTQLQMLKTDVLQRYLGYANEMVCGRGNQKEMVISSMARTVHW